MPAPPPTLHTSFIALALAGLVAFTPPAPAQAPPDDGPAVGGERSFDTYTCGKCKRVLSVPEGDDPPARCPNCNARIGYVIDENGNRRSISRWSVGGVVVAVVLTAARLAFWFYRNRSITGKAPDKRDPMYLRRQELLAEAEVIREVRGGGRAAPQIRKAPASDDPLPMADVPDDDAPPRPKARPAPIPAPEPPRPRPTNRAVVRPDARGDTGFELVEDEPPRRPAPPRRPPPVSPGFELVDDEPPPPRARVVPRKPPQSPGGGQS